MEQNLNKEVTKTEEVAIATDAKLVVKFAKPVQFEGKTFAELDLSEIENLTGAQIAHFETATQERGIIVPEISLVYAFLAASAATGLPIEFFEALKVKESLKVKRAVSAFMNS